MKATLLESGRLDSPGWPFIFVGKLIRAGNTTETPTLLWLSGPKMYTPFSESD